MIHRIYSDLKSFKELTFGPGLNVLVADRAPDSTDRQTRNGAGKSSCIEIIHFLTGADNPKESIFRNEALIDYWFGMDFDLGGRITTVERSGKSRSPLRVLEGNIDSWPIRPTHIGNDELWHISVSDWINILGNMFFGLPVDNSLGRYGPKFRQLFAYFVRRVSSGGFFEPTKQANQQQLGDQQVAISFLLGLDWQISQQWQEIRRKENALDTLKSESGQDEVLGSLLGKSAELRSQLFEAETELSRLRRNLASFRVLPQYRELENEASDLTSVINESSNENTIDRHLVAEFTKSLADETVPPANVLKDIYDDVGVSLPDTVVKRFEDVKRFHDSIIQNRQSYLGGEIAEANQRIRAREQVIDNADKRRAEIMTILNTHGALDQFIQLQSELSRLEAQTEAIRERFNVAERLEGQKVELEFERKQLMLRLQQDFREQDGVLRRAIEAFQGVSSRLYETAGRFTIGASENGPKFEITMPNSKSQGIKNMQIFCFDMMLMTVCAEHETSPGFLVHDSHLFDGVDERQIAHALVAGRDLADEYGFQYIVTMNSDVLPNENLFPANFDIDKHILGVKLTDETEEGGLFGLRF